MFSLSGSGSKSAGGGGGVGGGSGGSGGVGGGGGGGPSEMETSEDPGEDNAPLFYCPGKRGFYSPRQGKASFERLNAFRNTGRFPF
ncbi:hypothetical protein LSTR_LSTR014974 [Laodelphax striatellus]|uniref:Uncharacterized protein n=1 Tax=Laodelphax striatellus TaxID=195883 RepID=A0A482WMQ2_LAOST|nr:hypothetical protein LSTR_LSTR014974 [Laodelphax striatellus]